MGNIIKFPGKHIEPKARSVRFVAEKIDVNGTLPVGKLDFTCPTCYNQVTFRFEHMVFKNLQFFCSKCGSGWKVNNPVFSNNTGDQNKAT